MEEQRDLKSSDRVPPSPPVLGLQVVQQNRTTNFFIDNILRPDFGCRKDPGPDPGLGLREHSSVPILRPNLPGTPNLDPNLDSGCSSDSTSSSSSSSSSPKQSSRTGTGPAGPGGPGTLTDSDGVQTEDRTGGGDRVRNGTGTKAPDSQALLWPAWVYCTRYSDRPSSGKTRTSEPGPDRNQLLGPKHFDLTEK
ncbi:homeobox protein engrailed-1-like [Nematolebias whitei]|uniref:homeobox protein engrailed-1-like n=1 Tax=Nematolebias whitei TaxID=451745 RepID=UPI001897F506|nr:homeobox protein engrailed-1-like [Nematolebias whitei]